MSDRMRRYYHAHPLMVSSPFGGVDGVHRELLDDVFMKLGLAVANCRILDVGCGRGYLGDYIRERGGSYVGTDFVASRPESQPVLADAQALPFRPDVFDGICCVDAFEHFPDPARAVAQFRRVLKPGGWVFLSAPHYANVAGLVKWWCEHPGRYEKNTWAPFRNWAPQELEHALTAGQVRRLFREAGFGTMRRLGYGPEVGLGLFPWMGHSKMPEAVLFRMQRLFTRIGPGIAALAPGASLHSFWRIDG